MISMKNSYAQKGFTLVEVLIVLTLTGLFAGLIFSFAFGFWRYGYLLEADLNTFVSRLNAGDYLRENVGSSSGLIIQNSIADPNAMNPDPLITSNDYWEPIHAIPGNISVSTGTIPIIYFKRPSLDTSGDFAMNGSQPYEDEYVVYMDGDKDKIFVRTLSNPSVTNNRLLTSCPESIATISCPKDKEIISDIESVDMRYFSRTANTIDYTSIVDGFGNYIGPDFSVVEVAEFTLNIEKKPILQQTNATKSSTIIRIALRNT